jgi:A/G-specific adenine glycosylase
VWHHLLMTERNFFDSLKKDGLTPRVIESFRELILSRYRTHPRPMPWRETRDPYAILVSEVMLQQTRVERIVERYPLFLAAFPDISALAGASVAEVLAAWQGLGYNRRGIALKRAAEEVVDRFGGKIPKTEGELASLPGIGPYTAGAIAAFAFGSPAVFIETNIRSVFLHFFCADREGVPDRELFPLVATTLDRNDPRQWYYALMDYGVRLKKAHPNPSRRSRHHTVQSAFKGSNREIRGAILKTLLRRPGLTWEELSGETGKEPERVRGCLDALESEGFVVREEGEVYRVP